MPFPLPTPAQIAESQAAEMAAALKALRPDVSPAAIDRAVRSEKGLVAAHVRTDALSLYETHLHLRWWGDQYMPDTAEADQLVRHAAIWGVYRRAATRAVGYADVTGVPGTVVPAGLLFRTPSGAVVETAASGTIGAGGVLGIGLIAIEGGTAGNAPGGAVLPLITALSGLDPQSATLNLDGMAGGAEEETDASLLERLLKVIREPGHGGAAFDYPQWVQESFAAAKIATIPGWVGAGSVGVVVAMGTATEPRVPTGAELAAIAAHLEIVRPVTAEVHVVAYVPRVQAFTITVSPDTVANRAAVEAALIEHFAREAEIGVTMPFSRLSEAISAANGEYSHRLTNPPANIVPERDELPVLGAITWES